MPARDPASDDALADAMAQVLAPLTRLAIARGVKFPQMQEWMKQAFVRTARARDPNAGARDVSRVATTTGLTRREVTRLSLQQPPARAERPSPATQLFTRWMADRRLRDGRGRPRALPRRGAAPSFDTLARSITQDVHPRRLLDELLRLGLVALDPASDTVRPLRDAVVPATDDARMLALLGGNAGDHLAGAVANVLGDERRHFEQAVFADGLSDASVAAARKLVQAQWRALTAVLVPELQEWVDADERDAGAPKRRLRVGLYTFDEEIPDATNERA